MRQPIEDEFHGDTGNMRDSIKALIEMSDDGVLSTQLGGHARSLLASSYHRLTAAQDDSKRLEWLLANPGKVFDMLQRAPLSRAGIDATMKESNQDPSYPCTECGSMGVAIPNTICPICGGE